MGLLTSALAFGGIGNRFKEHVGEFRFRVTSRQVPTRLAINDGFSESPVAGDDRGNAVKHCLGWGNAEWFVKRGEDKEGGLGEKALQGIASRRRSLVEKAMKLNPVWKRPNRSSWPNKMEPRIGKTIPDGPESVQKVVATFPRKLNADE